MKILYAGTPSFAVAPLKQLVEAGYPVVGVVTQTDKPQGRKGVITPSPVKAYATETGIPVYQYDKIRLHADEVKAIGADVMVTCAYGQILTQEILDAFPKGVWNIHASLLPRYRGAAPIQWCVLNGEEYTGITVMKTDIGLDTGDILLVKRLKIGERETSGELAARLSSLGAEAIVEAMPLIERGAQDLLLQDSSQAFTVKKITREQAKLDFSRSAREIVNKVRGMNPEPIAYALLNGAPVNVFQAEICSESANEPFGTVVSDSPKKGLILSCGNGETVKILEAQMPGGKRVKGSDLLNGRKITKGQRFDL